MWARGQLLLLIHASVTAPDLGQLDPRCWRATTVIAPTFSARPSPTGRAPTTRWQATQCPRDLRSVLAWQATCPRTRWARRGMRLLSLPGPRDLLCCLQWRRVALVNPILLLASTPVQSVLPLLASRARRMLGHGLFTLLARRTDSASTRGHLLRVRALPAVTAHPGGAAFVRTCAPSGTARAVYSCSTVAPYSRDAHALDLGQHYGLSRTSRFLAHAHACQQARDLGGQAVHFLPPSSPRAFARALLLPRHHQTDALQRTEGGDAAQGRVTSACLVAAGSRVPVAETNVATALGAREQHAQRT